MLGSSLVFGMLALADVAAAADAPPVASETRKERRRARRDTGPAPSKAAPGDDVGDRVGVAFGKGVSFKSRDERFALTVRGRVQLRFSAVGPGVEGDPVDLAFQVRRARLVLQGNVFDRDLQFYVQLGLAPLDMEPDLMVPIRDAAMTWTGLRDLHIRFGQMKVPFNRERVVSSSALQMVDRSIVNAELNLDRDVGLQLFSNDLFGLGGRLRYQLGVFGGEGRNRWGPGPGLLYVGRVEIQPLGGFDDAYSEGDLTRDARPRLAIGGGFAYNHLATRERSTHGTFYTLGTYDTMHAEADLMFKVKGFSLMGEFLWRRAEPGERTDEATIDPETGEALVESSRSGLGWMAQAGYFFPAGAEVSLRFAELRPLADVVTSLSLKREAAVGLSWYVKGHDLKVQGDYALSFADDLEALTHTGRVQAQVYF